MKIRILLGLLAFQWLAGCSSMTSKPVALDQSYYESGEEVSVYVEPLPEASMKYPGASCLLCLGAAAAANDKLASRVSEFSTDELETIGIDVIKFFEDKGFTVHEMGEDFEVDRKALPRFRKPSQAEEGAVYTRRDYRSLREDVETDELLLLRFKHVGVERTYNGYIPTGQPQAVVQGQISLVDLETNELILNQSLQIHAKVDGEWDEPPNFPGITTAYYEVVEKARDRIVQTLQ